MDTKKFPLEAHGAAVSRAELVQAALDEITQNYREASLSNVARSYGVSLAYVSECVRAQTGRTYKELLQKHRMETAAREHQLLLPPVPRALRPKPPRVPPEPRRPHPHPGLNRKIKMHQKASRAFGTPFGVCAKGKVLDF